MRTYVVVYVCIYILRVHAMENVCVLWFCCLHDICIRNPQTGSPERARHRPRQQSAPTVISHLPGLFDPRFPSSLPLPPDARAATPFSGVQNWGMAVTVLPQSNPPCEAMRCVAVEEIDPSFLFLRPFSRSSSRASLGHVLAQLSKVKPKQWKE